MRVTATEPISGTISSLETPDGTELGVFRQLIASEFGIPLLRLQLFFGARPLAASDNTKSLESLGIKDGDVLVVVDSRGDAHSTSREQARPGSIENLLSTFARSFASQPTPARAPPSDAAIKQQAEKEASELLERHRAEPDFADVIQLTHPGVAEALRSGQRQPVVDALLSERRKEHEAVVERQRQWMKLLEDPLHPDSQRLLLDQIREQSINESYAQAHEHIPESFGNVFMLYVKIEVNRVPLRAFVDSGAQQTLMSRALAEKCGLMRLLDKRFCGIARGVGTSVIVGRIHVVQIKMGNHFFAASVIVLEDNKMGFLFGLDLLRRYQCAIDLKHNVLRIGNEALPFLSEAESLAGDVIAPTGSAGGQSTARLEGTLPTNLPPTVIDDARISQSPDQGLRMLLDLGFSRDAASRALQVCGGNAEMAAALLFEQQGSLR